MWEVYSQKVWLTFNYYLKVTVTGGNKAEDNTRYSHSEARLLRMALNLAHKNVFYKHKTRTYKHIFYTCMYVHLYVLK